MSQFLAAHPWGNTTLGLMTETGNITDNALASTTTSYGPIVNNYNAADVILGKQALKYFHDRAYRYDAYIYQDVDQLAAHYTKDPNIFYDGLGGAVSASREFLPDDKIKAAMEALADAGKGSIPSNTYTFFGRLVDIATNPSLALTLSYVIPESISTAGEGLEAFAESSTQALSSANFMLKYLPYILIGAGLLFILVYAKGLSKETGALVRSGLGR